MHTLIVELGNLNTATQIWHPGYLDRDSKDKDRDMLTRESKPSPRTWYSGERDLQAKLYL
jgi:hypothetical protein